MASSFVVERSTRLSFPADAVYEWHARPGAFERLTPPWERIEVLDRTGGIGDGSRTVVRVRAGPIGVRWVAGHRDNVPGRQFVDEQVEGPFAHWIHTHRFTPDGGGCLLTDRIEYAPPYGLLGAASNLWLLRPRIARMLAYRHAVLADDLAAHARFAGRARLHIAITGSSGLIGRPLAAFLETGGHRVTRVVRRAAGPGEVRWDPPQSALDPTALHGIDAVVHLAGEPVAAARWTAARRRRIRESRGMATRLLAEALAALPRPPRVLVSASAIGIYGNRGDEILTEASMTGSPTDFLVEVASEWEAAAEPARRAGIRVTHPRFGIVLSPAGGALRKLLPAFRAGIGGPVGDGRSWMSWISVDDAIGAVHHLLMDERLEGPVNAVGPAPATGATFAATLGRVLRRPTPFRLPRAALQVIFGEMAEATILASTRVLPVSLEAAGYPFRHPQLEPALRFLLGAGADDGRPAVSFGT
ncbi:MAG TPA: TIGR01777 family oxidoreductase [Gemmatimonadales bacterium]|nr:TIGR01777 family oxidoreductase [Gemmatimonadales bacterium]